jgi:hypothetical protein
VLFRSAAHVAPAGSAPPGHSTLAPEGLAEGARKEHALDRVTAREYAGYWVEELLGSVMRAFARAPWPPPHHRLRWDLPAGELVDLLYSSLALERERFGRERVDQLCTLFYPCDLLGLVDGFRVVAPQPPPEARSRLALDEGPLGAATWQPAIGEALAAQAHQLLLLSLQRMGRRYVAAADPLAAAGRTAEQIQLEISAGLVTSHPLDLLVARLLGTAGAVAYQPPAAGAAATKAQRELEREAQEAVAADPLTRGLRPVQLTWQGGEDPALWNWVRVTAPADVTPEEVAAALRRDPMLAARSYEAPFLTAAPPFFAIPAEWAAQHPEAARHRPRGAAAGPIDAQDALVWSRLGDEAALAQGDAQAHAAAPRAAHGPTPAATPDRVKLLDELDRSGLVLAYLTEQLAPWRAAAGLAPAQLFLERARLHVLEDAPAPLARWGRVIHAQAELLAQLGGDVKRLLSTLEPASTNAPATPPAHPAPPPDLTSPLAAVLVEYGRAAGASSLPATGPHALQLARRRAALLAVQLAERAVQSSAGAVAEQHAVQDHALKVSELGVGTELVQRELWERAGQLRLRQAQGDRKSVV